MRKWLRFSRFFLAWTLPATSLLSSVWAASGGSSEGARPLEPLKPEPLTFKNTLLNEGSPDRYAKHGSHRSHSSHSSHYSSSGSGSSGSSGSGSSGSGSSGTPGTGTGTPAGEKSGTPAGSAGSTAGTESGAAEALGLVPANGGAPTGSELASMVTRVQAALARLGYFKGEISGVLTEDTRSALRRFQKDKGLAESGRMDIGTLTALGISVN